MKKFNVIIIGAGAAGLMCAITAAHKGHRVLVVEHANKVGKKILMSGGGRCNFTHLNTSPEHFFSDNPHFCKSALKRYTPYDFLALVNKHCIAYVDKTVGQLFCQHQSRDILDMLLKECANAQVQIITHCTIHQINQHDDFQLTTSSDTYAADSLVIATGGLSIPSLGASGFGYDIARQFGLNVLPTRAALVPFTLHKQQLDFLSPLSGLSVNAAVSCHNTRLTGALLFTHRGLSGPVILQISPYWLAGDEIEIDLWPGQNLYDELKKNQQLHRKKQLKNVLASIFPKRLAQLCVDMWIENKALGQYQHSELKQFSHRCHHWIIKPTGSEGYRTAEVTLGGVDTDELSSKTMQAHKVTGLYFIGEVIDVTGQLGGYNFQWAWASGYAAGISV